MSCSSDPAGTFWRSVVYTVVCGVVSGFEFPALVVMVFVGVLLVSLLPSGLGGPLVWCAAGSLWTWGHKGPR